MNKIYYRWSCIRGGGVASLTGVGDRLVSGGYAKATDNIGGGLTLKSTPITSLSIAVSQASAMNRRLQSDGQDSRFEVFGQVFDTSAASDRLLSGLPADGKPRPTTASGTLDVVRDLGLSGTPPLEEAREQMYIRGDTEDLDLRRVIALSNRAAASGFSSLTDVANIDTGEDTNDQDITALAPP